MRQPGGGGGLSPETPRGRAPLSPAARLETLPDTPPPPALTPQPEDALQPLSWRGHFPVRITQLWDLGERSRPAPPAAQLD